MFFFWFFIKKNFKSKNKIEKKKEIKIEEHKRHLSLGEMKKKPKRKVKFNKKAKSTRFSPSKHVHGNEKKERLLIKFVAFCFANSSSRFFNF